MHCRRFHIEYGEHHLTLIIRHKSAVHGQGLVLKNERIVVNQSNGDSSIVTEDLKKVSGLQYRISILQNHLTFCKKHCLV